MINLGRVYIDKESDKAVRLSFNDGAYHSDHSIGRPVGYWFPKKLIRLEKGMYDRLELWTPRWLARNKKLI